MCHEPTNLSTGSMHPAFSTNHLADIDKTKQNYKHKQHNVNIHARKLITYEQTKTN